MRKELIPDFYNEFLAKPNESLYEHTYHVLRCLDDLKDYLSDEEFALLEYCCVYHDIGKINKNFQQRVISENTIKFDDKKEIGHNILSFLYVFNNSEKIPNGFSHDLIFNIILNHHHYVNNINEIEKLAREDSVGIRNYKETFIKNSDLSCKLPGIRKIDTLEKLYNSPNLREAVLKGFFHKCDYAASANLPVEISNKGLLARLDNKGYKWRSVQNFARAHSDENLIIVASTGLGKTEAALLWQGDNKGFYLLPVRTAINTMYRRIKNDFFSDDYKEQLGLLHGETQNIYINDKNLEDSTLFWDYYEKTRNRAYPLTICTPDQIFRFVFKYPGYEVDLATFSYSKIILDEIQAYSPDLLAAIIYGLQTINSVGGKFVITTATLAPVIRDWLDIQLDDEGNKIKKELKFAENEFLNEKVRHKVKLCDDFLNAEDIIKFFHKNKDAESLKILVVTNTVTASQKIYSQITSEIEEDCVKMIHSKFIVSDRRNLEHEISEDGKTNIKKHIIWIATQVVEASLDIDFDFLFTEFSDLSGLFQRMGRCNRKGVKSVAEYNIYVYEKIEKGLLCRKKANLSTERNGFIYSSLYKLGLKALNDWKEGCKTFEMSEEDKVYMIDKFYTMDKIRDEEKSGIYASYIWDYEERYKRLRNITPMDVDNVEFQEKFRNILSISAIPNVIYQDKLEFFAEIEGKINELYGKIKLSRHETEKSKLRLELAKLKNLIMDYTLPIEPYKRDKNLYMFKGRSKIYVTANIYEYSNKVGFFYKNSDDGEAIFW